MIQLNLLPDIKLEYIRAKRYRRLVTVISVAVTAFSIFIAVALFVNVKVIQARRISDLNSSITATTHKLQSNTNINKILTIQNQLTTLPGLNDNKAITSRLFGYGNNLGFLTQVTPSAVSIGTLNMDLTANTLSIEGTANNIYSVNQFADTLKFTKYYIGQDNSDQQSAFSEVTLTNFGYQQDGTVSYTITFNFDPNLFNIADQVTLDVPNIITTRSEIDTPPLLFNGKTGDSESSTSKPSQSNDSQSQ